MKETEPTLWCGVDVGSMREEKRGQEYSERSPLLPTLQFLPASHPPYTHFAAPASSLNAMIFLNQRVESFFSLSACMASHCVRAALFCHSSLRAIWVVLKLGLL